MKFKTKINHLNVDIVAPRGYDYCGSADIYWTADIIQSSAGIHRIDCIPEEVEVLIEKTDDEDNTEIIRLSLSDFNQVNVYVIFIDGGEFMPSYLRLDLNNKFLTIN